MRGGCEVDARCFRWEMLTVDWMESAAVVVLRLNSKLELVAPGKRLSFSNRLVHRVVDHF
jgi:hypothetical protein